MVMASVIDGYGFSAKKKAFPERNKERKKEICERFTNDHSQSKYSCEQAYQPAIVQKNPGRQSAAHGLATSKRDYSILANCLRDSNPGDTDQVL